MHAVGDLVLCSALVWSIVLHVGSDGIEVGTHELSRLEQASSDIKAKYDRFPGIHNYYCQQCGIETRLHKDSQSFTYLGIFTCFEVSPLGARSTEYCLTPKFAVLPNSRGQALAPLPPPACFREPR